MRKHGDHEISPRWARRLAPYAQADTRQAVWQLLSTLVPYALLWWLMLRSLDRGYALTLALAVPEALLFVRLFIFQHDCGHGSFFPSRRANDALGAVLGVLSLTPYAYWRKTHAIHHGTSGDLDRRSFGDIETMTVEEYLAASRWERLRYRAYRHPIVFLGLGPIFQFFLKHRLPLDAPWSWRREWRSVMGTNLALAGILTAAWLTIGIDRFLLVELPIRIIAGPIGIWLFYVQHQFEDTYWQRKPEWEFYEAGLEGSSFYDLPRVLHWLTGNIGVHHVHHMASRIPNYRLHEAMREVPELQRVTRLTLLESFRCVRYKLWDEVEQRLVGFDELERRRVAAA